MNEAEEKRMLDAFEESGGGCREYQVDADDPMVQHELIVWKAAWKVALAYQDDLIRAAYADAADLCEKRAEEEIIDDRYTSASDCGDAIKLRTPDDARRKREEMKK